MNRFPQFIRILRGVMFFFVLLPSSILLILVSLATMYSISTGTGNIEGDERHIVLISLIELVIGILLIVLPVSYARRGKIFYFFSRVYTYLVVALYTSFLYNKVYFVIPVLIIYIFADKLFTRWLNSRW